MGWGPRTHVQRYHIHGTELFVDDVAGSIAATWVANEMVLDEYGLCRIEFDPGDVVIDVGVFAIYRGILPMIGALGWCEGLDVEKRLKQR